MLPVEIHSVKTETPPAAQALRENKLRLVERLADDLAHEIKNPLHSMVINLEVLRRRLARLESGSGEDLLRYARVLAVELDRVNRRVDLLLRMVRPERESEELASLPELLEELHDLVELECERNHVTLEMEIPPGLLQPRLSRPVARQAILTLFLKTLEFVPPGGILRVQVAVEGGDVALRFEARGAEGGSPAAVLLAESDADFAVAATLAEQLGGRLEVNGNSGDASVHHHLVLCLDGTGGGPVREGT
jgi:signal transduction histidine kinase